MQRPALVPYVEPGLDDEEAPTLPRHESQVARAPLPSSPPPAYTRKISGTQPVARAAIARGRTPTFHGPSPDAKVIVVVDDDTACRALVARALSSRFTVFEASDGVDALQLLTAIDPPDAIVCDISMPRMDGIELARRVKVTPGMRRTAIVFLSARTGPMDVVTGINAGARAYVTKPFAIKDLVEKVAKTVR